MADTITSANMNLPVPVVGTDTGPDWANNINSCLTLIDAHDHSPGFGVPINPSGININADLSFISNNATNLRSVRFQTQGAVLTLPTDLGCLYEVGVDLYYNDGLGNNIRITQSGGVAGSQGSIAGLASPASATYVSADQTFVWQSAAATPANMDAGSYIFRNITANSKGLTLNPPAAMGSNFSLILPNIPGSTSIMRLDTSGAMSATLQPDGTSIAISGNTLSIATNAAIPGTNATVGGYSIVTSPGSTGALDVISGTVSSAGSGSGGGYTASRTGTGSYVIVFNTIYGATPFVSVSPITVGVSPSAPRFMMPYGVATDRFFLQTTDSSGTPINADFSFIAIGTR